MKKSITLIAIITATFLTKFSIASESERTDCFRIRQTEIDACLAAARKSLVGIDERERRFREQCLELSSLNVDCLSRPFPEKENILDKRDNCLKVSKHKANTCEKIPDNLRCPLEPVVEAAVAEIKKTDKWQYDCKFVETKLIGWNKRESGMVFHHAALFSCLTHSGEESKIAQRISSPVDVFSQMNLVDQTCTIDFVLGPWSGDPIE